MYFHVNRPTEDNNITIFACEDCGNATSLTAILNYEANLDNVVMRSVNLALAMARLDDITPRQIHAESIYKACNSKIVIQRAYRLDYKGLENDVFITIDRILSSISTEID